MDEDVAAASPTTATPTDRRGVPPAYLPHGAPWAALAEPRGCSPRPAARSTAVDALARRLPRRVARPAAAARPPRLLPRHRPRSSPPTPRLIALGLRLLAPPPGRSARHARGGRARGAGALARRRRSPDKAAAVAAGERRSHRPRVESGRADYGNGAGRERRRRRPAQRTSAAPGSTSLSRGPLVGLLRRALSVLALVAAGRRRARARRVRRARAPLDRSTATRSTGRSLADRPCRVAAVPRPDHGARLPPGRLYAPRERRAGAGRLLVAHPRCADRAALGSAPTTSSRRPG